MSGTGAAYVAAGLCPCYAMSGTEIAYAAVAHSDVWYWHSVCCYRATRLLRDVRAVVGQGLGAP
eukprot:1943665-Rhodomonas_salina.1